MAYSDLILATPNLLGYWRLGEVSGTVADDLAGTKDGTYVGSPTLNQTGLLTKDTDKAVTFASGKYVTLPANSLDGMVNSSLTIEAWIKPTTVAASMAIFSTDTQWNLVGYEVMLFVQPDGRIRFSFYDDMDTAAGLIVAGNIYHVVATYDLGTDTSRVYIDAVERVNGTKGPWVAGRTGYSPKIGMWTPWGPFYFTGQLDEVATYTRALTAEEIRRHYAMGKRHALLRSSGAWTVKPSKQRTGGIFVQKPVKRI